VKQLGQAVIELPGTTDHSDCRVEHSLKPLGVPGEGSELEKEKGEWKWKDGVKSGN